MPIVPWIIKSFRGGLSDEDSVGIKGSFKFGYGLDIHKRRDSLSCMQALKHSKKTSDLIKYFVLGSDGTTYAFGSGGTIYTKSPTGLFIERYNDANGEIKGAECWSVDDGSTYIVWATNTSVSIKQLWTGNSGNDWGNVVLNKHTNLDPSNWHTMKRASGALQIANDMFLATWGYDDTFDPASMQIEPGNTIKCLEDRDDYVILGSQSKGGMAEEGHIWSWQTSASNYIQKKKIPVLGINALIRTELLLLQGGVDGELFYSDFTNSVPVAKLPADNYQCNPGGATIDNDLASFGMYGGIYPGIWSYGRRHKNRPFTLNYDYRLVVGVNGSTVTQIGALTSVSGKLLVSWATLDGSTVVEYGVNEVDPDNKAIAVYETLEFDGGNPHLLKHFRDVHLIMSPLPVGCEIDVYYKSDKSNSWTLAKTPNNQIGFSVTNATEAIFTINKSSKIMELQISLIPNGNLTPEILSIITYIEPETDEYGK
jgi:hypothetical protein